MEQCSPASSTSLDSRPSHSRPTLILFEKIWCKNLDFVCRLKPENKEPHFYV